MSCACQTTIGFAYSSGQEIPSEVYCPCYLKVDSKTMLGLDCRALDAHESTVAETYEECLASPPHESTVAETNEGCPSQTPAPTPARPPS